MKKGTIVFFRESEDSVVPAIVIDSRDGGPAPHGHGDPDPATFADLAVFSASGTQTQRSVREGDDVGEFAAAPAAPPAAPKKKK